MAIELAFYEGLAGELRSKWKRLNTLTSHAPSIGRHHEEVLRDALRSMLSQRYSVVEGFCHDGESVSRQADILIVDENDPTATLFRSGQLRVVHPRAVACAIEVKTRLVKREFLRFVDAIPSFRFAPSRTDWQPRPFLFAFDSVPLTAGTLASWFQNANSTHTIENYPLGVFVLGRGLLKLAYRSELDFGIRAIIDDKGKLVTDARSLALFLAAVSKQVLAHTGRAENPYDLLPLGNDLCWSSDRLELPRRAAGGGSG